ncbi:hypothetical protein GCM10007425_02170 [Lysinibacillus alkalisoli]|uniref:NAD(P)-binding domain-containing protein n=1 Tax=Lysinibacillus alkalisoli TaxID=1911548 RepID=A0A917FXH9_9BACI|nr:NAD(P)H-binding protein [Lysinibacillus alkalisoli]GGG11417.1 hypothetical protein GCM10007425_02170 [Lysinibacillus alkalisoli]
MKKRSAIVVGATGLVGQALTQQLCEDDNYVDVTIIVRTAPQYRHPKLTIKVRDFERIEARDIDFAHEVFCCLGTTRKAAGSKVAFERVDFTYPLLIASLAKKKGIPHFLVISAMGANEASRFYYSRVKGKVEKALIAMDFDQLSIIRPSLLRGERAKFRLGEKSGAALLKVMKPLLQGPLRKYQAIEGVQVAQAMRCIALYQPVQKVKVYTSQELQNIEPPLQNEDDKKTFDWSKRG